MEISLSNIASVASILSIPVMLIIWLVTKDRFSSWWQKWSKYILLGGFIVAIFAAHKMRWLDWLWDKYVYPVWLIILIGSSGFLIILLVKIFSDFIADSSEEVPDFFKYTHDIIFDISCQWSYKNEKIDNYSLSFFCVNKNCSCRLDVEISRISDYIVVLCPHCGFRKQFNMSVENFKRSVVIEIERRLRTGEYKNSINS